MTATPVRLESLTYKQCWLDVHRTVAAERVVRLPLKPKGWFGVEYVAKIGTYHMRPPANTRHASPQ